MKFSDGVIEWRSASNGPKPPNRRYSVGVAERPNVGRFVCATYSPPVRKLRTRKLPDATFWKESDGVRFHVPPKSAGSENPGVQSTDVRNSRAKVRTTLSPGARER